VSAVVQLVVLVAVVAVIVGALLRRSAAGTREIAFLARGFCSFLDDVVAQDGRVPLDEYTTDDRTLAMSELQHLYRRVHDRKLRRDLGRALDAYDHSLALARPKDAEFANLDDLEAPSPQDVLGDEQRVHQVESAEISRAAFGDVLDRVRRLDRRALRGL
jgi:hypothetical protein